jgi:hypothetical protein
MLDADKSFFPVDPASVRPPFVADKLRWIDPLHSDEVALVGQDIQGEKDYFRLSEKERQVMEGYHSDVTYLSKHSAGLQLKFATDSLMIALDVDLLGPADMSHMPATGQCGFDLYVYDETLKRYLHHSTGTYDVKLQHYQVQLSAFNANDIRMRRYILNFPLYQGLSSLRLGIDPGATIAPVAFSHQKRIVLYGTSIAQGGVVSRPGMLYTNILSRWLDREILNYGFSGAALCEPLLGGILGERKETCLFVIDAEANAGCESWMRDNLKPFVYNYLEKSPQTPLLFLNRIPFAMDHYDPRRVQLNAYYLAFTKAFVHELRQKGIDARFLDMRHVFADEEATVDGIHPSDYGAMALAKAQYPVFKDMCEKAK